MKGSLLKLLGLVVALAVLLSGCATGYLLDNSVQSFSSLTALPAQPSYRFERLPSQQAPAQAQLEAMADAALHKAGLRRDDANPRYSVQVSARLQRVLSPWADPWDGWGWGGGWGSGCGIGGFGLGMGGPFGAHGVALVPPRSVGDHPRTAVKSRGVREPARPTTGPGWTTTRSFRPCSRPRFRVSPPRRRARAGWTSRSAR